MQYLIVIKDTSLLCENLKNISFYLVLICVSFCSSPVLPVMASVTDDEKLFFTDKKIPWLKYAPELRPGLILPVEDSLNEVVIPLQKLKRRIAYGGERAIEPVYLYIRPDQNSIKNAALKYAKKNTYDETILALSKLIKLNRKEHVSPGEKIKIKIDAKLLRLLEEKELRQRFRFLHHKLSLNSGKLSKEAEFQLMYELEPFFSEAELERIIKNIRDRQDLLVDQQLLPLFPRKVVRKFVVYQGPNCFHAALAFHDQVLTRSSYFNVTEEEGYHRAMINYDELWRALNSYFYVVDYRADSLRYGDLLVFFDLPEEDDEAISFRWIRHTASYLFNGYTFSKGSKSADTPYTVKTLSEEWKTWSRITKTLGVKIFRRSTKHVRNRPPKDLVDWIY